MPTARSIAVDGELSAGEVAGAFGRALRDRGNGRAVRACEKWAALEAAARETGQLHLAVQAGAERSLTLTWMGALSVAGVLCDQLLSELTELERGEQPLAPPPLDRAILHGWGGAWFSVAGLHRLRAEQLRRAGDYAGALEELEEAARRPHQRPDAALPLWGRVILSESLRLAGDFEGAYEVATAVQRRAAGAGACAHPWIPVAAARAVARALLALGELDDAQARFDAMATDPMHRNADGGIAADLGRGELERRRGRSDRAEQHLRRASAEALRSGQVVAWIHAQLGLAEVARARRVPRGEVAALVGEIHGRLLLSEHPFLRLRACLLAAVSESGERSERWLDRAEDELPRFHRRSCDLELERELVEVCRIAIACGEEPPPLALDVL